jgi:hypothetical protein
MKKLMLLGLIPVFIGCSTKQVEVKQLSNYSLYDDLYENVEQKELEKIKNLKEKDITILNVPKYIKAYRGSYKDENGNVVAGGMEFIKIDNGEPNTNF